MADKKGKDAKAKGGKGIWNLYTTTPQFSRKNEFCPKCNVFMADHKDRQSCGKCGHTVAKA